MPMEDPIPLARVLGSRNQPSANRRIKFPYTKGSSAGKESACNAGEPSWIPGSGRSPGEEIDHPLQYSWASLVAQIVENDLQWGRPGFDPWFQEDPQKKETATHSSILACRIYTVHGVSKSLT